MSASFPSDYARPNTLTATDHNDLAGSARKISAIADGLLDLARGKLKWRRRERIHHGNPSEDGELVDLKLLLQTETDRKRREHASRADVQFVFICSQSMQAALCRASYVELSRMVSNLLNNSVDAIESAGWIWISLFQQNGTWTIEIKDTGRGIDEAVLESLRTSKIVTNKVGGNGLGLFYVREYLEGIGGQLLINSAPGEGSTFSLLIPKVGAPSQLLSALDEQAQRLE